MTRRTARPRRVAAVVAAMLAAAVLAACGGGSASEDADAGASAQATAAPDASEFPLTIDHMLGTIELAEPPDRIVSVGIADNDIAFALGARPVAIVGSPDRDGLPYPWLEQQVDLDGVEVLPALESGEVSIETILALEPDLVLATTAFAPAESYDQLTAAGVPVLVAEHGYLEDSWQDLTRLVGRALGRSDAADEVITATEASITDVATRLPGLQGKTFVVALDRGPDGFNVLTEPSNFSVQLFGELGMVLPEQLNGVGGVGTTAGGVQISGERVDLLDADAVFLTRAAGVEPDSATQALLDDLPAATAGTLLEWPNEVAAGVRVATPLSIPYVLGHIEPTLAQVAAG